MGACVEKNWVKQRGLRTGITRAHTPRVLVHIPVAWGKCWAGVGWTNLQMGFSTKILLLREQGFFLHVQRPLQNLYSSKCDGF